MQNIKNLELNFIQFGACESLKKYLLFIDFHF
jgi:hypothetical protein